jgi:hypothetical protein
MGAVGFSLTDTDDTEGVVDVDGLPVVDEADDEDEWKPEGVDGGEGDDRPTTAADDYEE